MHFTKQFSVFLVHCKIKPKLSSEIHPCVA